MSAILQMAQASAGANIFSLGKVENKRKNASVTIYRCGTEIFFLTQQYRRWVRFERVSNINIRQANAKAESMLF